MSNLSNLDVTSEVLKTLSVLHPIISFDNIQLEIRKLIVCLHTGCNCVHQRSEQSEVHLPFYQ